MQTTAPTAKADESYIAVSTAAIVPSTIVGVSLYLKHGDEYKLYRDADFPFEDADLSSLRGRGVKKLYVSHQEHHVLQEYLRGNIDHLMQDESKPIEARFSVLNELVRGVLGEAFEAHNVQETVQTTREISERMVDVISRTDAVANRLCAVLHHDYHTFTHTANVSYYCVMLAKALGISDRSDLNAIATGALLHDLGKLEISAAILTKPGKLTDEEFAVIRQHPTTGLLALRGNPDLSFGQLMMVYQHHERLDGKGYPAGVGGDEIHEWALLCSVTDVFEALTSNRPYRSKMSFQTAFEIMDRPDENRFDREMLECWMAIIQKN